MAARLRRELGIEVEMRKAPYGHFEVLVDGETVVDAGKLAMLGVLPSVAEIVAAVRARIQERVVAGLARARAQGKHLGRPSHHVDGEDLARVAGLSVRAAAEELGVPKSILQRLRARQSHAAPAA